MDAEPQDPLGALRRGHLRSVGHDRSGRIRRRLSDDEAARLLDAAAGVLAATRTLVGVGEDIVRERRERLDDQPREPVDVDDADHETRGRIDLSY